VVKIIGLVSISSSTVNVIWIRPAQPNGIITTYEVMYSVYDDIVNVETYEVAGDENSLIVSDLGKRTVISLVASSVLSPVVYVAIETHIIYPCQLD